MAKMQWVLTGKHCGEEALKELTTLIGQHMCGKEEIVGPTKHLSLRPMLPFLFARSRGPISRQDWLI
jgi:hypothetical protein